MKQKNSFLLALAITFLIALNVFLFSFLEEDSKREVVVTRIIDGDTLEFDGKTIARLANINTPEKNEAGYSEAKDFLSKLLNKTVSIEELGEDKYSRILVRVYSPEYVNLQIVRQGFATKFLVEESELNEFAQAELSAVENENGLWKSSQYSNCFIIEIFPEKEKLIIENSCPNTHLENFVIRDESRKKYKLTSVKKSKVILHSGKGVDNETDIFWQSSENIWNDDRDTVYFIDDQNKLAYYKTYGYDFILSFIFTFCNGFRI